MKTRIDNHLSFSLCLDRCAGVCERGPREPRRRTLTQAASPSQEHRHHQDDNGNAITLSPESGPEVAVTVQPNARLLRIALGTRI